MDAYTAALTLLSRRELSATQLRERLARRDYDAREIDEAIERLRRNGTVDDRRVALAWARVQASIRGKGRRRVLQQVQRLGIDPETARTAVADVFDEVDEDALIDRAIDKRLKGRSATALDIRDRARIVRALVAQGFGASRVLARLRLRGVEGDE